MSAEVVLLSSSDPPEPTVRTAETRSEPSTCLSTNPDAPAMIALNSASSSWYEVSIRHRRPSVPDSSSRHSSTPLPSGNRTSSTATSAPEPGMRVSASPTDAASPAIRMSGSLSSRSARPRRTISWSSTRKTLMVIPAG